MKLVITAVILLTACTTTSESLIPCAEIEVTARHMEFFLEACIQNVFTQCDDGENDCAQSHVLKCYELHFGLKKVQARDYRLQKCWQLQVEQQ